LDRGKIAAERLVIRELGQVDIEKAEDLVRLAFGTFLHIPDPLENPEKKSMIAHRFHQNPGNVIAAYLDGELVGSNILTRWGSFAFLGPLTVRPDLWNAGVGTRLVDEAMKSFSKNGVENLGLFTFPDSPKHQGLYHKFGFCSRFLTPLMQKAINNSGEKNFEMFSSFHGDERDSVLQKASDLTNSLHPGLDLSSEIQLVDDLKLGETVLLFEQSKLIGFAICQSGADTEAGEGRCYVKFGAVRSPGRDFNDLLSACESYGTQRGASALEAGVNLSHDKAFDIMLRRGFQIMFIGVAMQKPNEPAHNRSENFVMDDWR